MLEIFGAGADEVLNLPLSLKELAYRLRSRAGEIGEAFRFHKGQLHNLEVAAEMVRKANLTDVEAQVLRVLMDNEGEIVSRDDLSLAIDKSRWDYGNRKFDVHVARIRKKLNQNYGSDLKVETIRAAGYQLKLPEKD